MSSRLAPFRSAESANRTRRPRHGYDLGRGGGLGGVRGQPPPPAVGPRGTRGHRPARPV